MIISESQLVHKHGHFLFKTYYRIKMTRGWVGKGFRCGAGAPCSIPAAAKFFFQICLRESQLIHKYGSLLLKSLKLVQVTLGWVDKGLMCGAGGSGSIPATAEIFFHPMEKEFPFLPPPPTIQPLEWEEGCPNPATSWPQILYTRQCVQKRIPRRCLGDVWDSPQPWRQMTLGLYTKCVGLLHILCRNICTHPNVCTKSTQSFLESWTGCIFEKWVNKFIAWINV
jgi:hypothetical protein